jgi:hypothetical protein
MLRKKGIVCADIRDIPQDAVPLVSYGGRKPGRGGSWEYEMLHRLCKADEIRYWKFTRGRTGQLFVMPDEADKALDELRERKSRQVKAICEGEGNVSGERSPAYQAQILASAARVEGLLERIAVALESMATNPASTKEVFLNAETFEELAVGN